MRRVVVTGLGLVTPLGGDVETTWANILASKSGAGPITRFDASDQKCRIACEVKPADHDDGFDPNKRVDHKVQRQVDPFIIYGIDAAGQAIEDAGLLDMPEEMRLRAGMKLDADPTVIYPITKGKPLGRRIKRSELNAITGYNTYREPGLPDGPIANPGRESIAAVLDPAPTQALYFVADGTGGHVFANTLAEHNANVAKWYAIRRARGEM